MPSYNFSSYRSNPSIRGNWNTGGSVVGRGSLAGGITPVGVERNRLGGVTQPQIAPRPPSVMPVMAPPTPQVPIQTLAPQPHPPPLQRQGAGWAGYIPGTQQADPAPYPGSNTTDVNMTPYRDPSVNYGNDQFGRSLMNSGFGVKNVRSNSGGGPGGLGRGVGGVGGR